MADHFVPIAPRPSPVKTTGFVPWARRNLFADWRSTLTTVLLAALIVYALPGLINWALLRAVFVNDADTCQAARGIGACWGVVTEKYRIILFGRYPFDEQWRPLVATSVMLGGLVLSCMRAFWKPWLPLLWVGVLAVFFVLMRGGAFGLSPVRTDLSHRTDLCGKFKVPTLRNIELTYPYFHDGAAETMTQAVDLMGRLQLGREFSKDENAKIVAFLKTLTGQQPQIALPIMPPSTDKTPKPRPFN